MNDMTISSSRPATKLWGVMLLLSFLFPACSRSDQPSRLSFEITAHAALDGSLPGHGRIFVILNSRAEAEPRFGIGWADPKADPFFAKDISNWNGKAVLTFGEEAIGFPIESLNKLAPGSYYAQALYDVDTTFSNLNAPGNFYSTPVKIEIAAGGQQRFRLTLDQRIPAEQLPQDSEYVKHVRIESRLLSAFWKKPMYLRAAIILPKGYAQDAQRRYPVRYTIGGYGSRYTNAARMMAEGSEFRRDWLSDECPRMLLVHLDGEAPFGDSYQMNSASNGPYGDATVQELIPHLEQNFRALATPESRFLTGGSTGGWVAL
ncbi:MAG: alpha/beta hydrolase-fold protein, partial [candidate division KSB1 bacterium]